MKLIKSIVPSLIILILGAITHYMYHHNSTHQKSVVIQSIGSNISANSDSRKSGQAALAAAQQQSWANQAATFDKMLASQK